jgi:hypothetical protein
MITIQRKQYRVIVHLFIVTGRNSDEIIFMTLNIYLQSTYITKVYQVFSSLLDLNRS